MSDTTEWARKTPETAARLVLVMHGRNASAASNAWDALVEVLGDAEALRYLTQEVVLADVDTATDAGARALLIIKSLHVRETATPLKNGTIVGDCSCGDEYTVPQGGDEYAALEAAHAQHVAEALNG